MSGTTPSAQACYTAEDRLKFWRQRAEESDGTITVFGSTWAPEPEIVFARVADIGPYCEKVLAHIGHEDPVAVRTRRGYKAAHYEPVAATIAIPIEGVHDSGWAMREHTVLHELAHHLTRWDADDHGPAFRAAFLELLRAVGQPVNATLLSIAYAEEGLA